MNSNKTWQGKTDGGNFGQRALFYYFRHGNVTLAYSLMSVIILFYLVINHHATKNIYQYFRKRQQFGRWKSIKSTYHNHFLFGKTLIDKFVIFAGRRNEYVVEELGRDVFYNQVNDTSKGAIILNSHVGSAEIAGYVLPQTDKRINSIVYGGEAAAMQTYRTKILDEQNIRLVPVTDGFSHLIGINNALQNSEFVSIAGDRIYEGSKNRECIFLGAKAHFPIGPFRLAVKMNVPVMALFVMQNGYKKYCCHVIKLEISDLQSFPVKQQEELLMDKYVAVLEQIMKQYPLQWYNFHDYWVQ